MIICTLPHDLKAIGNSITSFVSSLLGYLPAPFLYGYLYGVFEQKGEPRVALFITMCYSFAGVIFISLACIFRMRNFVSKDSLIEYIEKRDRGKSDLSYVAGISAMMHGQFIDVQSLERFDEKEKERYNLDNCAENISDQEDSIEENKIQKSLTKNNNNIKKDIKVSDGLNISSNLERNNHDNENVNDIRSDSYNNYNNEFEKNELCGKEEKLNNKNLTQKKKFQIKEVKKEMESENQEHAIEKIRNSYSYNIVKEKIPENKLYSSFQDEDEYKDLKYV